MHNFILNGCDTDSIMFSKPDGSQFSEDEQDKLLNELNSIFPEHIKWEHDGVFSRVIYLKAKNYIMYDGKKVKCKGSSLKSSTLEPALKEFMQEIINLLLNDQPNFTEVYNRYVKEIDTLTDIKRWASKKTLSTKTYESERENEGKIREAINGSEYVEGDKVYLFFDTNDKLVLAENFKGDYNKEKLYKKLHKTTERFDKILDTEKLFIDYSLKRNQEVLCNLLGKEYVKVRKTRKSSKKDLTLSSNSDSIIT